MYTRIHIALVLSLILGGAGAVSAKPVATVSTGTIAAVAPMPRELAEHFSRQINSELAAAYIYLSMASHFNEKNLTGLGRWFTVHFYEEIEHARKMITFMNDKGATVVFPSIPEAKTAIQRPVDAFVASLHHEEAQTAKIHALYEHAKTLRAYDAETFLHYFIQEQVEEEAIFTALVEKLTLLGDSPEGLLALDRELGARPFPKIE